MSRLILTDRDREALHRLAAEWRSEPTSEDRGTRTRETLIGLIGGGEHFDQHAAYLLALSLVELLSPAHLPPRAESIVLRALESLAEGEGGGEYVKIVNDLRGLPDAPMLPDSPFLTLLPDMGNSSAGGARAGPWSEGAGDSERYGSALRPGKAAASESRDPALRPGDVGDSERRAPALRPGDADDSGPRAPERRLAAIAERIREAAAGGPSPALHAARSSGADMVAGSPGGDASAAGPAPPPETPDPETGEHAIPHLPGVDIEALARRTMQFAGDGARDLAPSAENTTGSSGSGRDGARSIGSTPDDGVRNRMPGAYGATGDRARNRAPSAESTPGDDARYRAPVTPSLESVLFVESAGERFALRAGDVAAILGADAHAVARIGGRPPVFVHHGVSYHFVDLAPALALEDMRSAGESDQTRTIVLLRAGGRRVALLCGGVDEQEELPVHALPPMVPREALATAAVIAGDGRPTLILDTAALAQHATG